MKPRTIKLDYWVGKDGQYYCHLLSPNGQILFVSEGYKKRLSILKVYYALKRNGSNLELRKKPFPKSPC